MNTQHCPAWRADHLPAWLAAVGAAHLCGGVTLAWTNEPSPYALLNHPTNNPLNVIATAWPTPETWQQLPLPHHPNPDATTKDRSLHRPDWAQWATLAQRSRLDHTHGLLPSATHTDLTAEKIRNKPIPSPATGPIAGRGSRGRSAHHKATTVLKTIRNPKQMIHQSTAGTLPRSPTQKNKHLDGWGIDPYRLMPSERGGQPTVDPIIETLTLWGLAQLPVTTTTTGHVTRRGHITNTTPTDTLVWPAWTQPLDHHGIDALLDTWRSHWQPPQTRQNIGQPATKTIHHLGVIAAWRSHRLEAGTGTPPDRGYTSELIHTAPTPSPQRSSATTIE